MEGTRNSGNSTGKTGSTIDCARHAALAFNMNIQVDKHSDLCVFEPGLVCVYQVPEQLKAKKIHLSLGNQKANTAKQTKEERNKVLLNNARTICRTERF